METKNKTIITFLSLIILIALFYNSTQWLSRTTGYATGEDEKTLLAQCLTGKNIKLYVLPNCPACSNQRNLFGNAFNLISYTDCTDYKSCPRLTTFPSWEIDGKIFPGNKSLEELKNLSHCS